MRYCALARPIVANLGKYSQSRSQAGKMSTASSSSTVKTGKKISTKPSQEEIEAKRQLRAAKREKEAAEHKAKQADLDAAIAANGKIPNGHLDESGKVLFIPRDWASVSSAIQDSTKRRIKIVSWNILAQGLVRRTLFPGSDCLKFKDRSVGLIAELSSRTGHGWDVGTFQEVDRVDVHGPMLEKDGFSYVYEKGYRQKQHGLLIAWRKDLFGAADHRRLVVDLDAESVSPSPQPRRTACSRITRNIGLFVALRFLPKTATEQDSCNTTPGIIVATTHLFWHPMHAYERVRQSGILVRRLAEFQDSLGDEWVNAPSIFAGDFNDQPHSATYHLLNGKELTQHCLEEVHQSTVVHKSIDDRNQQTDFKSGFAPGTTEPIREAPKAKVLKPCAISVSPKNTANEDEPAEVGEADDVKEEEEEEEEAAEEEEEEGGADDQMLKNCRAATSRDGLLSIAELCQLHDLSRDRPSSDSKIESTVLKFPKRSLRSCYGLYYGDVSEPSETANMFGSAARGRERWDDPDWIPEQANVHTGDSKEPMWTIFSSLFSLTLDYIYLMPPCAQVALPSEKTVKVTSLLRTHWTDILQPGVPRKSVCASDHIAIGVEIEI